MWQRFATKDKSHARSRPLAFDRIYGGVVGPHVCRVASGRRSMPPCGISAGDFGSAPSPDWCLRASVNLATPDSVAISGVPRQSVFVPSEHVMTTTPKNRHLPRIPAVQSEVLRTAAPDGAFPSIREPTSSCVRELISNVVVGQPATGCAMRRSPSPGIDRRRRSGRKSISVPEKKRRYAFGFDSGIWDGPAGTDRQSRHHHRAPISGKDKIPFLARLTRRNDRAPI